MESPSWPESLPSNRRKAIQELTHGHEWINKLHEVLLWSGKTEPDLTSIDGVTVRVLEMFENTLLAMGSSSSARFSTSDLCFSRSTDYDRKSEIPDQMSTPRSVIPVKTKRGYKRRCRKYQWTSTKLASVFVDDGYAWRKYGQKEIQNTKFRRNYYRCTYKYDQGCLATKHVQMIEDEPPNYKITYFGRHTCNNLQRAPVLLFDSQIPRDGSILLSFETKGQIIDTKKVDSNLPTVKHEHHEGFPSLGNLRYKHSMSSNSTYQDVDLIEHVPQFLSEFQSESVSMDHEDMISSGVYSGLDNLDITSSWVNSSMASHQDCEMDYMFEMNDYSDLFL